MGGMQPPSQLMNPLNMMGSSNSEVDRSLIDVSFDGEQEDI